MMQTLPIRLTPGQDLRAALEAAVRGQGCHAAFVLSGIGSVSTAGLHRAHHGQGLAGSAAGLGVRP